MLQARTRVQHGERRIRNYRELQYLTTGEHPAGISKEQKRAIRGEVAKRSAMQTLPTVTNLLRKTGYCTVDFVDMRPGGLGYAKKLRKLTINVEKNF